MNKQKCIKRVLALFMIMVLVFTDFLGIWSNNVSAAKTVSVSKVKLDRTSATMMKGSTINLKATITPSNATNKKLKWTSSDKSVAVVYSSGRVLAKKAGKTTIKVTAGKKSASCCVTVKNPVAVEKVSLNKTIMSITPGKTTTLKATVYPSNATNKKIKWSSNNVKVASVSSTGIVKAKRVGTAKITARSADGGKIATCTVTVNVPLSGVSIDKDKIALDYAENASHTYQCKLTFSPSNASNQKVIWSSSDPKIAIVDADGKITAVERGIAEITVKSADGGKTDVIKVYVYKESTQYAIGGENKNWHFKLSADTTLAMSVASTNVTNGMNLQLSEYTQNSSQTWNLFGIAGKTDQMEITPKCASGKFVINNSSNLISMLAVANRGKDSTWELIKLWNDHNTYIIRLTGTQYVIAASSAKKGSQLVLKKFDPFDELQVWKAYTFHSPSDVNIINNNKKVENVALDLGKTFQCSATVSPEIAVNKNVTWLSSNTKVATVDSNGKVTAVARGIANITVKTVDSGKTASVKVCVYDSKAEARGIVNEDSGWWFKLKLAKDQNFVMNASGGTAKDNVNITLSEYDGTGAQMWKMTGKVGAWNMIPMCQGDHAYALAASGKTENSGLKLLKTGNINFEWIQLGDANNDRIYALKLAGTDLAVSASATIKSGTQLVLKKFNPFDESQKWIVEGVSCPSKVTIENVKENVALDVGKTFQCNVKVWQNSAENKNVTWSSSNTKVATVDKNGKITAVGKGEATITVKTVLGGKSATCKVIVKLSTVSVTGVSIDQTEEIKLDASYPNTKLKLTCTISPANATNKAVTWSISDTNIATVDANGYVTPKAAGIASIYATTADGNKVAEKKIYVYKTNVSMPAGWFYIKPKQNQNVCISVRNNNIAVNERLVLSTKAGSVGQNWRFDYINDRAGYAIVKVDHEEGRVLDIYRLTNGGTDINYGDYADLYQFDDPEAQIWNFVKLWDGSYRISLKSKNGKGLLTADGVGAGAYVSLQGFDWNNKNQEWVLEEFKAATSAPGVSGTDYASKLNALRNKYPSGSYWTGEFDGAEQCHGWALLVGYEISGVSARGWKQSDNLDGVKPGDLLRYQFSSNDGHTIVVIGVSGDTITYADCNGNGGANKIQWGATYNKSAGIWWKYPFTYRLIAP